jgi:hypothetical protein
MEPIARMLQSHPRPTAALGNTGAIAHAISSLATCAATCTSCADACLGEQAVASLTRCIRLNLDCADVCAATASLLSRRTDSDVDVVRSQLQACVVACHACAAECEGHADHMEHCQVCADACHACARVCRELLEAIPA